MRDVSVCSRLRGAGWGKETHLEAVADDAQKVVDDDVALSVAALGLGRAAAAHPVLEKLDDNERAGRAAASELVVDDDGARFHVERGDDLDDVAHCERKRPRRISTSARERRRRRQRGQEGGSSRSWNSGNFSAVTGTRMKVNESPHSSPPTLSMTSRIVLTCDWPSSTASQSGLTEPLSASDATRMRPSNVVSSERTSSLRRASRSSSRLAEMPLRAVVRSASIIRCRVDELVLLQPGSSL